VSGIESCRRSGVGRRPREECCWFDIIYELAKRLLIHVYPQEVSSDHLEFNKVLEQSITARIVSVETGDARARLDGHLTMDRAHAPPSAPANRIEANLAGYIDFDVQTRRVLAFKLPTNKATSDGKDFMVGITSQPKNYIEPAAQ